MDMKRKAGGIIYLVLALLGYMAVTKGFEKSPIPEDRITVLFSDTSQNLSHTITRLYSTVRASGHIYAAVFLLSHAGIAESLIEAHKKGVDVKIITDKVSLRYPKRKEIIDSLKSAGIQVRIKRKESNDEGSMHMKMSIVNDRYVIVGSNNYVKADSKPSDEDMVIIPAKIDKKAVRAFKAKFQEMWEDEGNYPPYNGNMTRGYSDGAGCDE